MEGNVVGCLGTLALDYNYVFTHFFASDGVAAISLRAGTTMKKQDPLIVLVLQAMAGGATRNTFDLYKSLKDRNWKVRLIVSDLEVSPRYRDELGAFEKADVSFVSMRRAPHTSDLRAFLKLRAMLIACNSNRIILHAHSTKAGMLGHLLRPYAHASIYSPHAYRGIDPRLRGVSKLIVQRVEAHYSRNYDRIIAEVPLEYDYALSIGLSKKQLRLIPNGIAVSTARLDDSYERRRTLASTPTLGFVGRLVYQKNPLLFVEVLNEVVKSGCDAKAIILGEGPLKGEMLKLAGSYGIAERIDWRGEAPAAGVYPEMDVMVHTSVYEAMAYSLIEACGALLPIAATTNPGSQAVLGTHLPGNLAPAPEPVQLAQIVLRILRDNRLRLEQLAILKTIAQEYSRETMIARLEDEYNQLLSGDARRE